MKRIFLYISSLILFLAVTSWGFAYADKPTVVGGNPIIDIETTNKSGST